MKRYLLTPGPTPIPEDVNLSMAEPILHHRTPEFADLFKGIIEGLQYVFQTSNDIIVFAATGTGAMQASISNFLSSSDKAVVIEGGKFGRRFARICKAFGVEVESIELDWGDVVDPEEVKNKLEKDDNIKAVFATLCETSSGVLTDIERIGEIVEPTHAILVVDAISGLGACDIKTDEWNVDVTVAGSQKGLMTPPGLSFISVSEKAWERAEESDLPTFYFDVHQAKKKLPKFNTPWTSAVTLTKGLSTALNRIKQEGLENYLSKYEKLAEATRAAVKELGLEIFASNPANAVTAVEVPSNIDAQEVVRIMKEEFGINIAGGQAHLKGKIFRIGHMGYMEKFDIISAISALEITLKKLGCDIELGKGVKVAEKILS